MIFLFLENINISIEAGVASQMNKSEKQVLLHHVDVIIIFCNRESGLSAG